LKYLIKECDLKSRYAREEVLRNESITNVKYYDCYDLMRKENIISRSIQEVTRIVDAKKAERQYGQKKLGYKYDFVDLEAQNASRSNDIIPSIVKYAHGFNHFGLRDSMINNNMIEAYCSRFHSLETWDYVVKCDETIELRKKFIKTLLI